jgi:hypothetical protein
MSLKASAEAMRIRQQCWSSRRMMAISKPSFLRCFKMCFAGWISHSRHSSGVLGAERCQDVPDSKDRDGTKSFTYPQVGFKLDGSKLTLSKIGFIRIFKHRDVEGKIKTCTIKKDHSGHWYATLVSDLEDVPQIEPKTALGVDASLKSLGALPLVKQSNIQDIYYLKNAPRAA